MPVLDRTLLPLIIAPIVGYLALSGSVTPQCEPEVSRALEVVLGGAIMIVWTILAFVIPKKPQDGTPTLTLKERLHLQEMYQKIKDFAVKKPQKPTNEI